MRKSLPSCIRMGICEGTNLCSVFLVSIQPFTKFLNTSETFDASYGVYIASTHSRLKMWTILSVFEQIYQLHQ